MAKYAGSTDERVLFSLPVKKCSLATSILSAVADLEFANSRAATEHLFELRNNQDSTAPMNSEHATQDLKKGIANTREELNNTILQQLREKISPK